MKESKKLRLIDKYVGSLICLIFSIIHKFKLKKKEGTIKNVLIMELFELGVATMIYPSLKYIKERLDNPNIYCITLIGMKEPWKKLNIIPEENIFAISGTNLFTFGISLVKQVNKLRKKDIDIILDFELFMRIPTIISFLIKSKYRAGFHKYEFEGLYRGSFYDFKCAFNQNTHISKNFLALTKSALNKASEYPNYKGRLDNSEIIVPTFKSNTNLEKRVKEEIKELYPEYKDNKLIIVAPDVGGNLRIRNYPKDYFVEVIKKLLNKYSNYLILLSGTKQDWSTCSYIKTKVNNERCINFSGKTTFNELFELINLSELLICNDNGPIHFAAITKTKTLALFSTDSPHMYGPLGNKCVILYSFYHCSPCITAYNHKKSKCKNNLCLQSIKPSIVIEYSINILKDKVNYGTINNKIPYI